MKVYQRIENGASEMVSQRDGLDEINNAMMSGRRNVKEMSQISRTDYVIGYKNGSTVMLKLVDEPQTETAAPVDEQPEATWSTAGAAMLLHRFTGEDDPKDRRALCNKRFRAWRYGNGYSFQTRTERDASEYGYLYTYCTRCEGK